MNIVISHYISTTPWAYFSVVILIASLLLNGFLGWYIYNLLKDRINLVDILKDFAPIVKSYNEHLESLTKMEMYSGEPTIMYLLEHTKEVNQSLDDLMKSVEIEDKLNDETKR